MFVFKTSGETFNSVVANQKHAFRHEPKNWDVGELVLVNRVGPGKRIQFTMRIKNIRPIRPGEAEKYWPGNEGRWNVMVECEQARPIRRPFNLIEILGPSAKPYGKAQGFARIKPDDEDKILRWLGQC